MYFENDVVQVDLDPSYLTDPDTAVIHLEELLKENGVEMDQHAATQFANGGDIVGDRSVGHGLSRWYQKSTNPV